MSDTSAPDVLPDLSLLCSPRVVAMVGASDDPASIGGRALINLLQHSAFQGEVMLVNPRRERVAGMRCWPDLASLPATPDLVMVAVPAAHVNPTLRQAAARGVPFAIVVSSGFGEAGPEGRRLEDEMRGIVAASRLRVYGPNCPGLCNINERLGFTFSPSFPHDLRAGPVGLATQGGGLGRNVLQAMDRGLGIGLWCSSGNEVDLQVSDFIAHMAEAPDIELIVTLIEGIKDGRKFVRAVQRAQAKGKPVIALKVGRSAYGQKAALSHTGSLTGSAEVNSQLFRQLGIVEVDDVDELADTAALMARAKLPHRDKRDVAVYCSSGGASALTADMVGQAGLKLASFAPQTTQVLASQLPPYAAIGNPVDTTTAVISDPTLIDSTLLAVCEDPSVGLVLMPVTIDYGDVTVKVAESVVRVQRQTDTPVLPIWMSSRAGEAVGVYAEAGLVPVASVGKAVKAAKRWLAHAERQASHATRPPFEPLLMSMTADELQGPARTLDESEGKALLRQAGIDVLDSGLARTPDQALQIAQRIGYPVVAKVVSPDITHKSDVGGVELDLWDGPQLLDAWDRIHAAVSRALTGVRIDGLLIESMAPSGGVETLVGVTRDPVFGPVLTFGLGGVHVELFRDVARRVLPLSREEAFAMLREIRAFPLLDGLRGRPLADVPALVELLLKVSDFVAAHPGRIDEMDLNPVWVGAVGQGVRPLDAVVVGRFPATPKPRAPPHEVAPG
jgi:acyl-CoA synthetase (NDP forming)